MNMTVFSGLNKFSRPSRTIIETDSGIQHEKTETPRQQESLRFYRSLHFVHDFRVACRGEATHLGNPVR